MGESAGDREDIVTPKLLLVNQVALPFAKDKMLHCGELDDILVWIPVHQRVATVLQNSSEALDQRCLHSRNGSEVNRAILADLQ